MQKPTARILLMAAAGAIAASLVSGVMGWPAVDGVRRDSSVYRDARGVKFPDVGWRVTFTTGDVMEVPTLAVLLRVSTDSDHTHVALAT